MDRINIIGGGLSGSLMAVYLAKRGYDIHLFERRPDMREHKLTAGRSINLALSERGVRALQRVGLDDDILGDGIPMYGRMMHGIDGKLSYQPYGKEGEAIFSISRGLTNACMIDQAEQKGNAHILFEHECVSADVKKGIITVKNLNTNELIHDSADVVFAADGAFSAIRYKALQKIQGFNYSQKFIEDGYREILLPANEDGSAKLDVNRLHIWPRGRFMLIALANNDNSFTCTLFMPHKGYEFSFDKSNNILASS